VNPIAHAAGAFGGLIIAALTVSFVNRRLGGRSPSLRQLASLIRQEDLTPAHADRFLFRSAPILALATISLAALFIPIGPRLIGLDATTGLFFFVVLLSPFVVAMMNAGWAGNGKHGLFGVFRAAAHLVSYEVPLGFAAIGPVMSAQSLSTTRIVEAQSSLWYVVWQPLGLVLFVIASLFASFRHPFDLAQADTELAGGVLAEYSGRRLLLFRLALDGLFALLMAMAVVLFLGGWHGPLLPGPVWMILKTICLAALALAMARRFPRLGHDQMLAFSWKVLLPASLLNVALVGVLALLLPARLQ